MEINYSDKVPLFTPDSFGLHAPGHARPDELSVEYTLGAVVFECDRWFMTNFITLPQESPSYIRVLQYQKLNE